MRRDTRNIKDQEVASSCGCVLSADISQLFKQISNCPALNLLGGLSVDERQCRLNLKMNLNGRLQGSGELISTGFKLTLLPWVDNRLLDRM